jgi:hypothetical protein
VSRTVEDLGAEVERRWAQIGVAPDAGGIKIIDLPQRVAQGQILLGVARDGSRLLVPLPPDAHRSFKLENRSRGVQLLLRRLEQDEGDRWYLDVVCVREELRWLFSSFVADILVRFERQSDVEPALIVRTCYSAWRALFAGAGPRLTLKQLAGLYGELIVLERVLARKPTAIGRWQGPLGGPHDFIGPGLDIEVKTTLSDEDEIVYIHGLDQLACATGAELRLAHLRVESPSPNGESLAEITDRLRAIDASGRLMALVATAGYQQEERHAYSAVTFGLVAEHWFIVDLTFPRLTANTFPGGNVPAGLADFGYTLDLATVATRSMSPADVELALDRVAG